jgi:hypothetical protein
MSAPPIVGAMTSLNRPPTAKAAAITTAASTNPAGTPRRAIRSRFFSTATGSRRNSRSLRARVSVQTQPAERQRPGRDRRRASRGASHLHRQHQQQGGWQLRRAETRLRAIPGAARRRPPDEDKSPRRPPAAAFRANQAPPFSLKGHSQTLAQAFIHRRKARSTVSWATSRL